MAFFSDFLASLSKSARAALPSIRGLAQTDLSPTAIVKALRDSGVAIRTQDALDAVAALRGNVEGARAVRLTPTNQILNPDNFTIYPGNLNRTFGFSVLARGLAPSGETLNQYFLITSNELLTKEQILAKAEAFAFTKEKRY